ncbi:MAG: hypothetical protein HQK71_03950 [Desulfamplus sp.]|nr:hypothetical protein [Desulfamplus sp.]
MGEKILGVEISLDSLSAVVIKRGLKSCTILDLGITLLNRFDTKEFADKFEKLLSKLNLKGCKNAAICLPASLISFRSLTIPFNSESKIRQILNYELNSHLPVSNVSYISDFIQVSSLNSIFTASVPTDIIALCSSVLKKHGLEPELITAQGIISSNYIINSKKRDKNSSAITVLVEKTKYSTVISFIFKEDVLAVRSFLGTKDAKFIQNTVHHTLVGLSQQYDIENHKINIVNLDDEINIGELIDLSNRANRDIFDLSDYLSDQLPDDLPDPLQTTPKWFNAITVAAHSTKQNKMINFCQQEYANSSFFNKFKIDIITFLIFAAITAIALFINIEHEVFELKKEIRAIDNEIAATFTKTFPDVKNVVEPLMQMQVKLREAKSQIAFGSDKIGRLPNQNIKAIEILYELSSRVSDDVDVEVTRFLMSEGRVVLAGTTDNFNSVDKIKTMIEKYDRFKSVTISSATADKTGNRVLFNFIIELI